VFWNNGYYNNITDAQQAALAFVQSQMTVVEATVYRIQYPDVQFRELVPVDTSAPEWTKSVTFYSMDVTGQAQWFDIRAQDVPLADLTKERFEQGVEMAAIGYSYDIQEVAQAMSLGIALPAEKADAARRASEEFLDIRGLSGDTQKGWTGIFNAAGVTIITVPNDGTGSSRAWTAKTPVQIMRDFNSALTSLFNVSLGTEVADTVLAPNDILSFLAEAQVPNTTMTLLSWIMQNNAYTYRTGRQLMVRGVRGLETAGAGGVGRMIFYRRDPQVVKMHLPMPHRFWPVAPRHPGFVFDVPGLFRFGGVEVRRPMAMRYLDAIM
jgi:hypothetical protein